MNPPYTFEHNGVKIEYYRATVRTGIEAGRLRRRLVQIYGYGALVPSQDYDNMDEYASAMARSKADAPWWGHSNMSDEALKATFEAFLDEDEDLYDKYREAHIMLATPKKTI